MARRLPIDADHPAYDPGTAGPNGFPQCPRCMGDVRSAAAGGFCSRACRHDWLIRTSASYARRAVFVRDKGVCTHCRTDCGLIDRMIRRLAQVRCEEEPELGPELARRALAALGFGERARPVSTWAADHRTPIAEGGRDCGLGNYRTLCLLCHAQETRRLHRRLREARAPG